MVDIAFIAFLPILLLLGGYLLLWYVSRRRQRRRTNTPVLNEVFVVVGWAVLLAGVFLFILMSTWTVAIALCPAVIFILIAGVRWYRRAEARTLLWALTDAADRGVSLEAIARAFGDETRGLMGRRAVKLADYLEAAVPLSLALRLAKIPVSPDLQLAADVGERNGTLGDSLRKVSRQIDENDLIMRAVMEKSFYLIFLCCWLPLAMAFLLSFLFIRITPIHEELAEQLDAPLPAVTVKLLELGRLFVNEWFLILPVLILFGLVVLAGLLSYTGYSLRRLPILRRFVWRADSAAILRLLAIAVREGRPIVESSRLLAGYFAQPGPRRQLERAADKMNKGGTWWEALRQVGIVRTSESRLLAAAERAGNLPWAMEELASSIMRRIAYRTRAWVTASIPVLILIFGCGVLLVALAIHAPIVKLIQWLC